MVVGFNIRRGTYNLPPGSRPKHLNKAEFDGTGWTDGCDGSDGPENCPLIFVKLCGHLGLIYTTYTCIQNKSCSQYSYGFQNLMSSWGSCSKISKLQHVGDFSCFGSKSSLLVSKIFFNYVYNFRVHK